MSLKRVFDITVASAVLLGLSPLMLLLAVSVRLESPGGALFRQTRVGRARRDFTIYKFRTMTVMERGGPSHFDCGDQRRVTALGAWLRRLKLDELPQFINVLKGDMSLVGPRPEVRPWVEVYPERWAKVLSVRPGLTDEASIEFKDEEKLLALASDPERLYRETILPRKLKHGEAYAARNNFLGDLSILVRTLQAIISGRKVYSAMEHGDSQKLIAAAYKRRVDERADRLYDCFQAGALYISQAQERSWLWLLGRIGFSGGRLREKKIYEVGCGAGGMLARLLLWGAAPENLSGCDLLPERTAEAVRRLPAAVTIKTGDAAASEAEAGVYDLVFQSTYFSSVISPDHRRAVAREMWRLASPGGWVVSYDMRYFNPANRDVHPTLPAELAEYFPEAAESFSRSVLLVPPLARRLARAGFWLCDFLGFFPFLRGHLIAAFRKA